MNKKVIIDCDNTMGLPGWEIDDGLVLLYLLGRSDIDIVGITNTFGNGSLKDVEHYTKFLLDELGRKDIPRFTGEPFNQQNPGLLLDIREGDRYKDEILPQEFPSDAARFLAEKVAEYPGEISILALGPVGNLYDAWRLDNDFYKNTKEIVLMGGYTEDLILNGRSCRELNLSCNPQAAFSMLYAECPVVVFNGHICLQAPFEAKDMKRIDMWPESRLKVVRDWLNQFSDYFEDGRFYLWDLLPAVYLSYPELFDLKPVEIAPTLESLHFGMLQPVNAGASGTDAEITSIIMPDNILDPEEFMNVLEEAWRREWVLESSAWKEPSSV